MDNKEIDWQKRALELEDTLIKAKLTVSYAKDVIENWPKMTIRTVSEMGKKIDALKEAVEFSE